jgi:hypothetical protein
MSKPIKIVIIILIIIGIVGMILYLYGFSSGVQQERKRAREVVKGTRIMTDMDMIASIASYILANESDCSKISCNHPEMEKPCQDIKEQLGTLPIIHSRETKRIIDCDWCAYVKIPSPYNTYYCIDSEGHKYKTDTDPGKEGYCTEATFKCPPGY